MRLACWALLLLSLTSLCAGCGKKGPLYLPENAHQSQKGSQ
ncbi:lipoprotein [Legionella sp. W05-934-2]